MSFGNLPSEVQSQIIGLVADNSSWREGLRLRGVSRLFDREIQAQYFDFGKIHTSMDEDKDQLTLKMGPSTYIDYLKDRYAPDGRERP
ncbi:hypothetical protein CLAIMM_03893 [Cladophialophora immunda]|nr:hypothetical protein CLAIMM_03893 [Cladophialophora immunda]